MHTWLTPARIIAITALTMTMLLPSSALAVRNAAEFAAMCRAQGLSALFHPPRCVSLSGGSTSSRGGGGSSPNLPAPTGPTPQQLQQQSERAMHDANDGGTEAFKRGNYADALRYFQTALEQDPDDPTVLENLRATRTKLREESDRRAAASRASVAAAAASPSTALDQLRSAQSHGQAAAAQGSSEEARKVFDTVGTRVSASAGSANPRAAQARMQIPPALANNPEIRRLQTQRTGLVGQLQSLEQRLATIREQKSRSPADRGQLEVQEAKAKQDISNVTSQIAVVDVQTESFVINVTRANSTSPKPPPSALSNSQ